MTPNVPPALALRPSGLSPSPSPSQLSMGNATNGCRSRETGVIEKLLASYGFIKCADREGRLFFHYSQFHGEALNLNLNGNLNSNCKRDSFGDLNSFLCMLLTCGLLLSGLSYHPNFEWCCLIKRHCPDFSIYDLSYSAVISLLILRLVGP